MTRLGSGSRPFIKSQGSVLVIVFETGPENTRLTYLGFRAEYTFTTTRDWPNKPYNYGDKSAYSYLYACLFYNCFIT